MSPEDDFKIPNVVEVTMDVKADPLACHDPTYELWMNWLGHKSGLENQKN